MAHGRTCENQILMKYASIDRLNFLHSGMSYRFLLPSTGKRA